MHEGDHTHAAATAALPRKLLLLLDYPVQLAQPVVVTIVVVDVAIIHG